MRDVQRIAIVDPSDVTREELRNVLLGMESVWLEAECSRYEFFFDVISQSQPDVAVNLSATLAGENGHSVALIDLDLALGDADVALDLMADYTLADVALNVDRLDMQFLKRSLSKHSSGVSLLPHPVQVEDASLIRE